MKRRTLFSVIWYIVRSIHLGRFLFLSVVGLTWIVGAIYFFTRPDVSEKALHVDLQQAVALLEAEEPRYIQLTADLDFTRKIYRTGTWAPFWGHCPPDEVHPLPPADAPEEDYIRLLGCRVQVPTGAGDQTTTLSRTLENDDGTTTKQKILLVNPAGRNNRVLLRSDIFDASGSDDRDWIAQSEYSGVLSTYDRALSMLPRGFVNIKYIPSQPHIYVINPSRSYPPESLEHFRSHYWVPVADSDRLFVWMTPHLAQVFDGTLSGMLTPLKHRDYKARDREYAQFDTVLRRGLPEPFGIIEIMSGEEYNRKQSGTAGVMMIFGWMWFAAGAIGLFLFFKAPGWIYDAWVKALAELNLGFPEDAVQQRPAVPHTTTNIGPIAPMSIPSQENSAHSEDASNPHEPFRAGQYLAVTQDFMLLHNRGGLFNIWRTCDTEEEAELAIGRAGQRYPCLLLKVVRTSSQVFSTCDFERVRLAEYQAWGGDWILLHHVNTRYHHKLYCISATAPRGDRQQQAALLKRLKEQDCFGFVAEITMIFDSEHPFYSGIQMSEGDSMIKGIN